eukprot:3207444-Pleurochrysis_carterae.AAC.1
MVGPDRAWVCSWQSLDLLISTAKKDGKYDEGVADITGSSVQLLKARAAAAHSRPRALYHASALRRTRRCRACA